MLKRHSQFFETLMLLGDLILIAGAWLFAYYIRFYGPFPLDEPVPPLAPYVLLLAPLLIIWTVSFKQFGLYRPRRIASRAREVWDIARASGLALLLLTALTFFYRGFSFSRLVFLIFGATSIAALCLARGFFRETLRFFRRRGFNLREVLVVGTGRTARKVLDTIHEHPELGLRVAGVLTDGTGPVGESFQGHAVLGDSRDIRQILRQRPVDQVFIALPFRAGELLEKILSDLGDTMADIKFIPDFHGYMTLRGGIEEFEGLPIVTLQDTPLYGWNALIKRSLDLIVGGAALVLFAPLMGLIALAIKSTSFGPVFFRQERMGLDGRRFQILKFRTMVDDAEILTGPVWATANDPRVTPLGRWLRCFSLDELPQLINVLRGEMSLVGPRPERPPLIDEFRKSIPNYMLRHKIKAGMTGWAQIHGWRGNSSLEKRIECDIYYIENWSLGFDLKILARSLIHGFYHENAH
jgi:Undecaprenyl-phosphate glucose phosphotransferase